MFLLNFRFNSLIEKQLLSLENTYLTQKEPEFAIEHKVWFFLDLNLRQDSLKLLELDCPEFFRIFCIIG